MAGLLESKSKGLIIVADDQYVNLQAMRMAVEDIGISANDRLLMFQNGNEVVGCIDELLSQIDDVK